jgi:hypothetical protein
MKIPTGTSSASDHRSGGRAVLTSGPAGRQRHGPACGNVTRARRSGRPPTVAAESGYEPFGGFGTGGSCESHRRSASTLPWQPSISVASTFRPSKSPCARRWTVPTPPMQVLLSGGLSSITSLFSARSAQSSFGRGTSPPSGWHVSRYCCSPNPLATSIDRFVFVFPPQPTAPATMRATTKQRAAEVAATTIGRIMPRCASGLVAPTKQARMGQCSRMSPEGDS